jgi:hypothetical protein
MSTQLNLEKITQKGFFPCESGYEGTISQQGDISREDGGDTKDTVFISKIGFNKRCSVTWYYNLYQA